MAGDWEESPTCTSWSSTHSRTLASTEAAAEYLRSSSSTTRWASSCAGGRVGGQAGIEPALFRPAARPAHLSRAPRSSSATPLRARPKVRLLHAVPLAQLRVQLAQGRLQRLLQRRVAGVGGVNGGGLGFGL